MGVGGCYRSGCRCGVIGGRGGLVGIASAVAIAVPVVPISVASTIAVANAVGLAIVPVTIGGPPIERGGQVQFRRCCCFEDAFADCPFVERLDPREAHRGFFQPLEIKGACPLDEGW